jgi:hypothetical protein
MTSNLQSKSGDEDLQRASDGRGEPSAPSDRTPQPRERQRRPAPMANRPAASPVIAGKAPANFDPSSSREALIATAAYYRAEKRGFLPGHELQDWLAAEREIDGVGTGPA